MECKQEERIADLENGKAKPIVTVVKNLLYGKTIEDKTEEFARIRRVLDDEYHVIPVLNHEAICVSNSVTTSKLWNLIDATDMGEPKEPELKASDFPCIDYFGADNNRQVVFIDTEWLYQIGDKYRHIFKIESGQVSNINYIVKVEKCKLSDIKTGDSFITAFSAIAKSIPPNYNYCTYSGDTIEVLCPNFGILLKRQYELCDDEVYRFTLK